MKRDRGFALASAWLLGWVLLNAWICDDGYVSMRTVEAFLRGDGLVWNPGVRVQASTHPLWLLLLVALRGSGMGAYTALLLPGLLATTALIFGLRRVAVSDRALAPVLFALAASPSFVHFSTSGLEGSLTNALLVAFFALFLRGARLLSLSLVAALLLLNRLDTLLLVAPALAIAAREASRREGWPRALLALGLGALPLATWMLFALVYYGTPLPNTAYAKLAHGLPRAELLAQGASYLLTSLTFDPAGALIALVGLGLASLRRDRLGIALSLGAFLYLLYIVWVGGDFMAGRFTTPLVIFGALALATSARWEAWLSRPATFAATIALTLATLALPAHHVATPLRASLRWTIPRGALPLHSTHWVTVEQRYYWEAAALLEVLRREDAPPHHEWARRGAALGRAGGVYGVQNIGFAGHAAGAGAHLVDPFALSDPFLARLPAFRNINWHVGHYRRAIPDGYEESIDAGQCQMDDEELCRLWDDVELVTRAPLFARRRWDAIGRLLFHRPSARLVHDRRHGERVYTPARPTRPVAFVDSGVEIRLDETSRSDWAAEVTPCLPYAVIFRRGEVEVHRVDAFAEPVPGSCVLRASPAGEAYDGVVILTLARPGPYRYHGPFDPGSAP